MSAAEEELQRNARQAIGQYLAFAEQSLGASCSIENAEGALQAIVEHVRRARSPQAAFEMLARHADEVGKVLLPEGR